MRIPVGGVSLLAFGCLVGADLSAQGAATPAEERMASWDRHVEMRESSPFRDLEWRAVGPRLQGGRIEAIAAEPGGSTVYVGAGSGNLWKTVNNGITWDPIFEDHSTFAIGSVDVAPSDSDVVWLGTGEVLMARSSYAGTGVFKSTDAGETWRHMGLAETHHIGRVLVHPEDPDVVYVAALGHMYSTNPERGLYRTTDGGETWEKVLHVSERTGIVDVVMDPTDPETLYAVSWGLVRQAWDYQWTGPENGIHKSTDGGDTWERLSGGLPSGDHIGRMGVAVARTNPEVVYALVANDAPRPEEDEEGSVGGQVFRSEDGGRSWRQVNEDHLPTRIGYDFCLIRVSPDREDEIWVLGHYLLSSDDGGRTYERNQGTLVHLLRHDSRVLHLDHHALWIDPAEPDRLLLGNDGGFHISEDRGRSWFHLNNLPIGEFYAVHADDSEPYRVYGGTQDDAALFGPVDQPIAPDLPDPWEQVYVDRWGGGDSYFTYPDPTDPNTIYYEHQFGALRRKNMETDSVLDIQPEAEEGEPDLRYNWMTPFFISRHNPYTLYYGANKVLKSIDRGDRWRSISPDLTTDPGPEKQGKVPYGTITTLSESPLEAGVLWVGTDDGNVQLTRDDGVRWSRLDRGLPGRWVSRVEASSHELGTAYVSLTGYRRDDFSTYLYRTDDFGRTWRSIAGDLPDEPVNVIREDPENPDLLYVGTDLGAYVSLDRGESWHSLSTHLPTTPVYDLRIQARADELVAGTHGRSVFVLDLEPIRAAAAEGVGT